LESETFDDVCGAIARGRVHVSDHAHDEAAGDDLSVLAVIGATPAGEVIEDYPTDPRVEAASCSRA
jgi:hypothetical protein